MSEHKTEREMRFSPSQHSQVLNVTNSNETAYTSKEMTEILGVSNSSVRKYSIMLENESYNIMRNPVNHRIYVDRDITALRRMIALSKSGTLVSDAAKIVKEEMDGKVGKDLQTELSEQLFDYIDIQNELIREQAREIEAVKGKLDKVLHILESGADTALGSENDNNNKEVQREYKEDTKKKKGLFKRLFNR